MYNNTKYVYVYKELSGISCPRVSDSAVVPSIYLLLIRDFQGMENLLSVRTLGSQSASRQCPHVSASALLSIYPAPSSHQPLPPPPRSVPWAHE